MPLHLGQVLQRRGTAVQTVFFLESGVASLVSETADGAQVEVGMTGREGFVGVSALLAPDRQAVCHACMQAAGTAKCIAVPALRSVLPACGGLLTLCFAYVQAVLLQSAQTGACNARHSLVQRLSCWLLLMYDRIDGDELPTTQAILGKMLGVRRAGVTQATDVLQASGAIRKRRGGVVVTDRARLLEASCGCYRIMRPGHLQAMAAA